MIINFVIGDSDEEFSVDIPQALYNKIVKEATTRRMQPEELIGKIISSEIEKELELEN